MTLNWSLLRRFRLRIVQLCVLKGNILLGPVLCCELKDVSYGKQDFMLRQGSLFAQNFLSKFQDFFYRINFKVVQDDSTLAHAELFLLSIMDLHGKVDKKTMII